MNNTYYFGDIHGDAISSLCKKNNKYFPFDEDDICIQLGDWGIRWTFDGSPFGKSEKIWKQDTYQLEWLKNNIKCPIVVCTGNHSNYDWLKTLPKKEFTENNKSKIFDDTFYIARYDPEYPQIRFIDEPEYCKIKGRRYIFLPKADSHDIKDGVLDPYAPDYKQRKRDMEYHNKIFWRTNHLDYWYQEKPDIDAINSIADYAMRIYEDTNEDYIIVSHDVPAWYLTFGIGGPRMKPTEGELELEKVRQRIPHKIWLAGHMHHNVNLYDSKLDRWLLEVYTNIIDLDDIENYCEEWRYN